MREAAKSDRGAAEEPAAYGCGVCGTTFTTMRATTLHATEAHLS